MTPYKCFKVYLAIKTHFNSEKYDIFKHNGQIKTTLQKFNDRKDKDIITRLARRASPEKYILANIVDDVRALPYNFNEESYTRYKRVRESMYEVFKNDLANVNDLKSDMVDLYYSNQIQIESMCILQKMVDITKYMNYDVLSNDLKLLIRNYEPFISVDLMKYKSFVLDNFNMRGKKIGR